jgi:hypothetical protein
LKSRFGVSKQNGGFRVRVKGLSSEYFGSVLHEYISLERS